MSLQSSSSFRRFGQRDDRRRRLLTEELSKPSDSPACHVWPEDAPPPRRSEHYGDAEFLEHQSQLLDLVPRRMVSLVLLPIAAAAIVVGLEASYAWMLERVANGGAAVTALDLAAKGSLSCWFSSLVLLAASVGAILVYSVRRHRTDDYQGRYRIWLWAAACWFLMATDQAASLQEGFRDLMISLAGTPLLGDGVLWWAILYACALGAVGSRLLIDMRSSLLSTGALLGAAIAQALVLAGRLGWILPEGGSREVMFLVGTEMIGNLLLLAAMTLHARYVLLDAQGLLPRRQPRSEEELAEEETTADHAGSPASAGDRWKKIDPPHTTPQPAFQRAATPLAASSVSTSSPAPTPISSPVNRKLTKAERRAMKERLLRERLERQRRSG